MTEYELGEMMHNQSGHMWQAGQMYFTLVSAYLITAYLVGQKLTRAQAGVITSLYLVWIASVIIGQIGAGATYVRLVNALSEIGSVAISQTAEIETPVSIYSFTFVQLASVIASLWFMWSVRHPRTE